MILGGLKDRVRFAVLEREPVSIHPSHDMQPQGGEGKTGEECFKCMLCTCHGAPELAVPCGQPTPQPEVPKKIKSNIIDIRGFQK